MPPSPPDASGADTRFLAGGGELSALILAHDWSATPLGPVEGWPQSLKTTVSLMLNSRHPMWVGWGPEATFLYNDAYISVLSLAKHPWALGRPTSEVWAEIWHVCGPWVAGVFERGEPYFEDDLRLFMKRSDCIEEVFYSFSYSPIRDESGGVGGLFCPSAETTAQVLNARRLATLSELANKALVKGEVHDACRTAMDTIATNPDDVPFALLFLAGEDGRLSLRSTSNLPHPDPETQMARTWLAHEVQATGRARTVDVPPLAGLPIGLADQPIVRARVLPVARSSEERPLGVLVAAISPARPLDRDYGRFFGLLAHQLASTIQNARAAEETRARAEKLAELDRAKTVFFSNVSHELRTPLTLLLGPLEELAGDAAADEAAARNAALALRNGQRLHKLVNTLLDFARIEAGRMRASYAPTDLGALTAELASNFRSAIEKAGMQLVIACEPDGEPVYVDREMWEKVVLNLLSNAFKYTLQGEIAVRLRQQDGRVVLAVSDTGSGIPAAELPRLFERFHRVEGAQGRTHEGTGIGLALVQELVKLHGGGIEVRSEAGRGSTFEVALPLGHAHLPPEQVASTPAAAAHAGAGRGAYLAEALGWLAPEAGAPEPTLPPAAGAARILLAEDNADMRAYIGRMLRSEGYVVELAADGQEALERAVAQPPDLVLTDVMMPRLDGFGLLKALRTAPATAATPIVLLSARAGEEARVEGLHAGADDYLVKPFSARELLGRVGGTLAVARIRQEALDLERQLRREIEVILESIREGFIALDRDWRFTYVNAEAERIKNVGRQELLGRSFWDVYPAALGTPLEERFRQVMERREPAHFENYYEPWARWFEISGYPVGDGGISIYYRDITERKKTEDLARDAERRKDEFIATLAHELRNPLAPIRAALDVLRRAPETASATALREMMDRQVSHMVRLIDDLMDVARISRGRLELRRERVALSDAVQSAIETSRPLFDGAGHRLRLAMPGHEVWLDADPTRLAQVIANLLNNAAKYTPHGGDIRLEAQHADGELRIAVSDNGAGIPAPLLPLVFEMFTQGEDTLARAQGGLGIGLTLVRQLARLHGGDVAAQSAGPGLGSTFTVTLPTLPPEQRAPETASAAAEGAAQRCLEVLVADDNVDAATTLAMLLELMGHRCTAVHDGAAAVEAFERLQPDVVLLDIGMPRMDGYQVARELRRLQQQRRPRIVALTGWGAAADRQRTREAGFDLHLTKPVEFDALRTALASA